MKLSAPIKFKLYLITQFQFIFLLFLFINNSEAQQNTFSNEENINKENWCGFISDKSEKYLSTQCVTLSPIPPCILSASIDSFIPDTSSPVKYFSLLIVVVDSNIYGVTQENIDTMMADVNNYFNQWKIAFCYTTDFIDSSQLSSYPQNADSIINVVINDWSFLGMSGNPIKIDYSVVINNNYQGGYSLAHELGHNFGMLHIFTGLQGPPYDNYQCSDPCRDRVDYPTSFQDTVGDMIADTPPTPKNNNCAPPQGTDTCSAGNPPWSAYGYENIMGYAYCPNANFTPKQVGKMHCIFNYPSSLTNGLLIYGSQHCTPLTTIGNVDDEQKIIFELLPNPFSEVATIRFTLLQDAPVKIEVRNHLGQHVANLYNQSVNKGQEKRVDFKSKDLPSGIYFVQLKVNDQTLVRKIVLLR